MATPNEPVPPKKPNPQAVQPGKPAPGAKPAAKPQAAASKTATTAEKPAAKAGNGKPAAPKPAVAPKKRESKGATGGKRRFGQVLVDLGLIDEDQLWEVLEEGKNTAQPVGQVAMTRGLITEDQLLQALGEQHNLKVVNLQEVKPQPEALQLVPETMASVYKVVPLTFKDKVLTIAIGDPNNLAALDDLRNLLNITEVQAQLATPQAIADAIGKAYAGKEESIIDLIQEIENNPELGKRRAETSIDLEDMFEMA